VAPDNSWSHFQPNLLIHRLTGLGQSLDINYFFMTFLALAKLWIDSYDFIVYHVKEQVKSFLFDLSADGLESTF
jgi:hypothetical protein